MKIRVGKLFELKNGYRKGFCAITPDLNDESSIEKYLDELSVVLNDNKIYFESLLKAMVKNLYFTLKKGLFTILNNIRLLGLAP